MEFLGCFALVVIFIVLGVLLFKEEHKEQIENQKRQEDLERIKEKLAFYKQVDNFNRDNTIYKIGEWENVVREDLKPIIKIDNKYNANKKVKVIIGDYDKTSVRNSVSVLESMDLNVTIAKSGIEIIERITSGEKYDLIITNNIYDRGHCDGPEMLVKLKQLPNFNTPIIVLTVSTGKRNEFIFDLKFDEYMTKLLTQEEVRKTLPKVIPDLKFKKV